MRTFGCFVDASQIHRLQRPAAGGRRPVTLRLKCIGHLTGAKGPRLLEVCTTRPPRYVPQRLTAANARGWKHSMACIPVRDRRKRAEE